MVAVVVPASTFPPSICREVETVTEFIFLGPKITVDSDCSHEIQRCLVLGWTSLIAQLVKNPPAMQETPVQFLGWEDPLEKGKATPSSTVGLPLWLSW